MNSSRDIFITDSRMCTCCRLAEFDLKIEKWTYFIQLEEQEYAVISCSRFEQTLRTMKWNISQHCVQLSSIVMESFYDIWMEKNHQEELQCQGKIVE
jgi:hypothetical protein